VGFRRDGIRRDGIRRDGIWGWNLRMESEDVIQL
jgi:hypothetical protein